MAIDYLLEVFKVDVAKLLSGGTVWAETARVWIEKIGNGAFYGSGVEKVVIPDSVKEIGGYVFYGCESLKEVVIGKR